MEQQGQASLGAACSGRARTLGRGAGLAVAPRAPPALYDGCPCGLGFTWKVRANQLLLPPSPRLRCEGQSPCLYQMDGRTPALGMRKLRDTYQMYVCVGGGRDRLIQPLRPASPLRALLLLCAAYPPDTCGSVGWQQPGFPASPPCLCSRTAMVASHTAPAENVLLLPDFCAYPHQLMSAAETPPCPASGLSFFPSPTASHREDSLHAFCQPQSLASGCLEPCVLEDSGEQIHTWEE